MDGKKTISRALHKTVAVAACAALVGTLVPAAALAAEGKQGERMPLSTQSPQKAVGVSCGDSHTVCVTASGDLYAFGNNFFDQLGVETENRKVSSPIRVALNVASVSCGLLHTAFITASGNLYACGFNDFGQLGSNTHRAFGSFVEVASNVASVSCGEMHTAYITTSGDLYVFGHNECGQLGHEPGTCGDAKDDYTPWHNAVPAKVASNVASVSCGYVHTAYVTTSGDLYTFGSNTCGELGDGSVENRSTPTKVASNVASVSCGSSHTAYITTSGELYAFGGNYSGQLGHEPGSSGDVSNESSANYNSSAVKVASNVASVSCGLNTTAYVTASGDLFVCGLNNYGQLGHEPGACGDLSEEFGYETDIYTVMYNPNPAKIASDVARVANGGYFTAYTTKSGDLYTLGSNGYGQLGLGSCDYDLHPAPARVVLSSVEESSANTNTTPTTTPVAKPKISKSKLTLKVGKTFKLKVKNAGSAKVKWSSSKKKVATVSKSGKVKAKKKGRCTIAAKVGSKVLKCKVIVKKK